MGKKNKKKNNNNKSNSSDNNVKSNNVIVKSDTEQIILTQSQQEDLELYVSNQKQKAVDYYESRKQEADDYYESRKQEADKLAREVENTFEERVNQQVEKEVKEKTQSLKSREDMLTNNLEKYNKECALLEKEKYNYKNEQLEIIRQEMSTIVEEKEKIEAENENLIVSNRRLVAENKSLNENADEYREQLKKISKNDGNSFALQNKIEILEEEVKQFKNMYKEKSNEVSKLSSILLQCDNDPNELINSNLNLSKENKKLKDCLSAYPPEEEINKLRDMREEYTNRLEKYKEMYVENEKLKQEKYDLELSKSELELIKKSLESMEKQKEELEKELKRTWDLYNINVNSVFATLSMIDEEEFISFDNINITLKDLCEQFRGYLQNRSKNPLYYDAQTIRSFIAGLASSRTMILEGLSGTGKTRLPMSFGDFAHVKVNVISVQSSWKDRNDLLGYYNDFKKQYKETEFLKAIYQACCDPNNIYFIVLDEMNLSRIEYYFADFLSVLEKDEEQWQIDLISDYASINNNGMFPKKIHEGKLCLGNNIWFIGTANKDDSTFMISDKVYDRSTVIYFDKKGEKEQLLSSFSEIKLNKDTLLRLFSKASDFDSLDDKDEFRKIIKDLDKEVKELFDITFGNRIENQLAKFVPAYIKCGGTVEEALDCVFSRKILRKLEGIYDENTKENLEKLEEYILDRYKMPLSLEMIEKLVKTK